MAAALDAGAVDANTLGIVYTVYMETRDAILAAAKDAFEECGGAGLSLRDVASRVGLTPMAIYRHFENKQALLDALVAKATDEWRARVAAIRPCAPKEWLLKIGDAFLDFALREPRSFEAAFLTPSPNALRYPDDFVAGGSSAVSLQLQLLGELTAHRPRKSQTTPVEIVIFLAGLAQGLISLYRAGRIAGDERAFISLYRRALSTCIQSFTLEPGT
jgi:AcrR family transcriptional regulator